ncbi:MAG: hypothetical protein II920_04190 [Clostridia bacterium]|nr:hypothetical protein [Clostridia bacterium]
MANTLVSFVPAQVCAQSAYSGYQSGYGEVRYTQPGADGGRAVFTLPLTLKGASFSKAHLSYSVSGGAGTRHVRFSGTSTEATDAEILRRLNRGDNEIELYFSFRAAGGSGGEGSHSVACVWSDIALEIEYIPSGGAGGTFIFSESEVTWHVDRLSLKRGESARFAFSISGALPSALLMYVDGGEGEESDILTVNAPGESCEAVFTLNNATWQGRLAEARVKMRLEFQDAQEESAWTNAGFKLCQSYLTPVVSAVFSDDNGFDQDFGGFVQGKSALRCLVAAALDTQADAETTIISRSLLFGAQAYTSGTDEFVLGTSDLSGQVPFTATVTDSHGETGELSGSVNIIPYAAPSLSELSFERYSAIVDTAGNPVYEPDDSSRNIRVSALGRVSPVGGVNAWTLTVKSEGGSSEYTDALAGGADGEGILLSNDRTVFTRELAETEDWLFTVTLADMFESAVYRFVLPASSAILDVEKGGVAVGMRSKGSAALPLFEVSYPAVFYGEVSLPGMDTGWQSANLTNCAEYDADRAVKYRRVGEMAFLRGGVRLSGALSSAAPGSSVGEVTLMTLPNGFRPTYPNEFAVVPERSNCYMHIKIDTDGTLKLYNRSGYSVGTNTLIALNFCYLRS